MSGPPYTDYHPRWYRPRVSVWWWLGRRPYVAFIVRELTSVFVAWSVVFLLLLVGAVGRGSSAYAGFLDWADTPWVVVLNGLTLVMLGYHAVTWFALTPKAIVVKLRGRRLPGAAIVGPAYLAWIVTSALICWLVLRE